MARRKGPVAVLEGFESKNPGMVLAPKGTGRRSEEFDGPTFGDIREGDVLKGRYRVLSVAGPGARSPYEGVMWIKAIAGEGDDVTRVVFEGKQTRPFRGTVERKGQPWRKDR